MRVLACLLELTLVELTVKTISTFDVHACSKRYARACPVEIMRYVQTSVVHL